MMGDKIRVLFLPRWYPHRYDPMPGLFIQRQAEALTPLCDVAVVYIHPDPDCPNKFEVEFAEEHEVRVLRVYYRVPQNDHSPFAAVLKFVRFYRAAMKAVNSIRQFQPQIVHAHILTRMGFIAWRSARKFKIPYVVSEHWSRYFPQNGTYTGHLRKIITGFVVRRAGAVIPVSEPLKDVMIGYGLVNPNYIVIPNVVDTALFSLKPKMESGGLKIMLHVSCFEDKSKNISGFLRVLKSVSRIRQDFQCLFVGDGPDFLAMKEYSEELGIFNTFAVFKGMMTPGELAVQFSEADFSVLSSHYETFGSVVVESLACGIPVVATNTGIAAEIIGEHNGILVVPDDEEALLDAIIRMLDQHAGYSRTTVRNSLPSRFSATAVASQINEMYKMISDKTRKENE